MSAGEATPGGDRPVLITGGAGFVGANLADRLAGEGRAVIVYDALARAGVEANLAWLKARHPGRVTAVVADIRDAGELARAVREAGACFHFAAQVAVTTSLGDPRGDMEVNIGGTLNLLEAVRTLPHPVPVLFASTNKVYGGLPDIALRAEGDRYLPEDESVRARGVAEARPLDFYTPYGCSKGAADQYVLDYARSYRVPAAVMRMSCIYGPRQMGTEDQGWVAHFLIRALEGRPVTIYGDGRQIRDVLHVRDAVNAYCAALGRIGAVAGRAFNLGGGPANAVSLLAFLDHVERLTGRPVARAFRDWRPGDQRYYVSDTTRLRASLDLPAFTPWREGVADLYRWLGETRSAAPAHSRTAAALAGAAE